MFASGFSEETDAVVCFNDTEAWVMRFILDYIYTGNAVASLWQLPRLAQEADVLGLTDLAVICVEEATPYITTANCVEMLNAGNACGLEALVAQSKQVLEQNWAQVVDTGGFAKLTIDHFQGILNGDPAPASDEELFTATVKWLKMQSPEGQQRAAEHLLPSLRFPLMDPIFLVDTVLQEEVVTSAPVWPSLYLEAMTYKTLTAAKGGTSSSHFPSESPRTKKRRRMAWLTWGKCHPEADICISDDGQVASKMNGNRWGYVTADIGEPWTSGKHTWAVEITQHGNPKRNNLCIGVMRPDDARPWDLGTCFIDHYQGRGGEIFFKGDIIQVKLDLDDGSICFLRNNIMIGEPRCEITGPVITAVLVTSPGQIVTFVPLT